MVSEQRAIRAIPANGFLHDYVIEWGMNRCDANVGFHIAAGLVLLAQTVPIGFGLPWHGRPLRANFYALLVGESTWSGKSTVVECAERILAQVCPERIMQDPGSRERFTDAIIEHPQQILLLGEFGAFLNSTERGYRNDLRTALTDAYDCPRMSRDTVERKRRNAKTSEEHPRLSVLGGCTPAFLETFTSPVDWEGGFLARFFSILASSEREQNAPPAPMPEVERSLVARLNGYLSGGLERPPGPCLGLSQGAVQAWRAWLVEIRARAHEARPALAAALGRSRTFAAKIALLLAWDLGEARSGRPWEIGEYEMRAAIRITELANSSMGEILESLVTTRDMQDRRSVLRTIRAAPTPLGRIVREAQLVKARVLVMLDTLTAEGTIAAVVLESGEVCYTSVESQNVLPFPHGRPGSEVGRRPDDEQKRWLAAQAGADLTGPRPARDT